MAVSRTQDVDNLDNVVRSHIVTWRKARRMTQAAFALAIERNPAWVSRYEKGSFDADFNTVRKMAVVLGHTLSAALNIEERRDKREAELIECYRALRVETRQLALDVVRELAGLPHRKTR